MLLRLSQMLPLSVVMFAADIDLPRSFFFAFVRRFECLPFPRRTTTVRSTMEYYWDWIFRPYEVKGEITVRRKETSEHYPRVPSRCPQREHTVQSVYTNHLHKRPRNATATRTKKNKKHKTCHTQISIRKPMISWARKPSTKIKLSL